ncbi:hypothetical protein BpHYR1_003566 [Brachionus plicatilis]|uniref:Uncharacterized protein n=1 Tax=Brachionus plicatilis TaxID=10195 RepID=A0A3M7QDX0_BRAPC|nr:hypothetical protein BpHYR1_003566 [Brachionus plicatilis]
MKKGGKMLFIRRKKISKSKKLKKFSFKKRFSKNYPWFLHLNLSKTPFYIFFSSLKNPLKSVAKAMNRTKI